LVADESTELAALETELAPELAALEMDDALALALETAPPAEEEAEEAEEAGAEVEPPVAVEEGRLLLVSGILNFHNTAMAGGTYEAVEEESPVVVTAPVETEEAFAWRQEFELPA
jgi:hypothetical protein